MEGPLGPRGLGPKSIKIITSHENHEHPDFLRTWKRCVSKFCEGSTDLELQIIDMELTGAVLFKNNENVTVCKICP